MKLSDVPRYCRTARHLRFSQLAARTRRRLSRQLARTATPSVPADVLRHVSSSHRQQLGTVACAEGNRLSDTELISLLSRGLFRQLNQTLEVGFQRPDWRLGKVTSDRLAVVTLHYHSWVFQLATLVAGDDPALSTSAGQLLRHYLSHWLDHCDVGMPGTDELACNSYAIATRLGWWIRALSKLGPRFASVDAQLGRRWLEATWRQAAHLHRNLEWDLRANHLLRDAVGLAWAGRFFAGREPEHWLRTATRIAKDQVDEQVLSDGGHFERSPSYHLEVMNDVAVLMQLLSDHGAVAVLRDRWRQMRDFASWIHYADGRVPQLNDSVRSHVGASLALGAAIGMAGADQLSGAFPHRKSVGAVIDDYPPATPVSVPHGAHYFAETGLVVWHGSRWDVFFDIGPVGPDYQPGHAHADTLTLECAFRGKRLFIDPGSHGYDDDQRRRYDRSTDAHNTVCIDGVDSSEVWHIFRVGRRARPFAIEVSSWEDGFKASAAHDGYRGLQGRPVHARQVCLSEQEGLRVTDRLSGGGHHLASGGLLLDPEWQVSSTEGGWLLRSGADLLRVGVTAQSKLQLSVESRSFHPDRGVASRSPRLQWCYGGPFPLEVTITVQTCKAPSEHQRSPAKLS